MNIYGVYGANGWPVCEPLALHYQNTSNEDVREIAQRFNMNSERRYACILVCFRDGTSVAFTF